MPERLHTDRKLIGTKQVLKALKAGRVAAVYVADDADPMLSRWSGSAGTRASRSSPSPR